MDKLINYAFISYKQIKPDNDWAQLLYSQLISWHIPTDIKADSRLNKNKTIRPIIRDKNNFPPGGKLDETIKSALRQSQCLILILSKEMIKNQIYLRANGEQAYIFNEIDYFRSLERPSNAIIPVYIDADNDNPEDILPPMLKGSDILILNVNDYTKESEKESKNNSKFQIKRTSAAIAAGIFGQDQNLFWDYHHRAIQKLRRKIAFWTGAPILIVALIFLVFWLIQIQQKKAEEALRLIRWSEEAYNAQDNQVAMIFALEAIEKSPHLSEAQINLRKFTIKDNTKPLAILPRGVIPNMNGDELLYYEKSSNNIRILSTTDLSEIEKIKYSGLHLWQMAFSGDSNRIAILGADSLRIYDRTTKTFIYSRRNLFHIGNYRSDEEFFFDKKGQCCIRNEYNRIIRLNICTEQSDTLIAEKLFQNLQLIGETTYVGLKDTANFGIYRCDFTSKQFVPIVTIPEKPDKWIFHAATRQIAFCKNDSLYRITGSGNKLYCGPANDVSRLLFSPDGIWLLSLTNNNLNITDSLGNSRHTTIIQEAGVKSVLWGKENDLLIQYKDHISIWDLNYLQKWAKLPLPHLDNHLQLIAANSILVTTSKIWIFEGKDPNCVIYKYPKKQTYSRKNHRSNSAYTFDGAYHWYQYYNNGQEMVECVNTHKDSIVWSHTGVIPIVDSKIRNWTSPKRHSCVLVEKYSYDSPCLEIKIIDIPTGEIMFKHDSVAFDRFLSEAHIVYEYKDTTYITNIKNHQSICVGRLNRGNAYYNRDKTDFSIDYIEHGSKMAIIDLLNAYVFDLSTGEKLFQTPIDTKDVVFNMIKLSCDGKYLLINQMYNSDDDDHHNRSVLSVWNIQTKKTTIQTTLDEIHDLILFSNNKYLFLAAWDRASIYDCQTGECINTLYFSARPCAVLKLPNGNILISFLNNTTCEMDLSKGKVVQQKPYYGIIGDEIIGEHYILVNNKLIDLRNDKAIIKIDNGFRPVAITDTVMVLRKHQSATQQTEIIMPFRNQNELIQQIQSQIGRRTLTPAERLKYQK